MPPRWLTCQMGPPKIRECCSVNRRLAPISTDEPTMASFRVRGLRSRGRSRSRSTCRRASPATTTSLRPSTPRRLGPLALFPGWGRLTPFVIDVARHRLKGPDPLRSRRYASRRQLPQGLRQASRFVANTRPDQHGILLVRAVRDLERHRHERDGARTRQSLAICAHSGTHELRGRRCGNRVLRRQVSLPLLAALHGYPARQRGRQRRYGRRPGVAAAAVDAAGPAAAVPHSADSRLSIRSRHDVGRRR